MSELISYHEQHYTTLVLFEPRIQGGVEVLEEIEGCHNQHHQEKGIVVEDGKSSGFIISHLVLLPQDPEIQQNQS